MIFGYLKPCVFLQAESLDELFDFFLIVFGLNHENVTWSKLHVLTVEIQDEMPRVLKVIIACYLVVFFDTRQKDWCHGTMGTWNLVEGAKGISNLLGWHNLNTVNRWKYVALALR